MYHASKGAGMLALAIGLFLTIPMVAAELYKWTDAEGKVHYSDQPPPPEVKTPVTVKPRRPAAETTAPGQEAAPAAGAAKTYVEQEAEFRKRQVEAAEKAEAEKKAADAKAEKQRTCSRAKAQLASLQAGRIARPNASGEREYLTDAEIAQEIERTRQAMDANCN